MAAFLRLWLVLLIVLPLAFVLVRIHVASLERERLEKRWDAGRGSGTRDDFVAAGMARYRDSLGRKLLWGVIVLPIVAIHVIVYVLNFT